MNLKAMNIRAISFCKSIPPFFANERKRGNINLNIYRARLIDTKKNYFFTPRFKKNVFFLLFYATTVEYYIRVIEKTKNLACYCMCAIYMLELKLIFKQ